jgi:hypothetical protein
MSADDREDMTVLVSNARDCPSVLAIIDDGVEGLFAPSGVSQGSSILKAYIKMRVIVLKEAYGAMYEPLFCAVLLFRTLSVGLSRRE